MILSDYSVFMNVFLTLAVAFVNGFTDAPNAVSSCVVTRSLSLNKAVILAALFDFIGAATMGILNGKVTQTVVSLAQFGGNGSFALSGAMLSVVIWAVAAWRFGIPTSESHALLAALLGAGIAVNGGFSSVESEEWLKVIYGLVISIALGVASGFIFSKLTVHFFRFKNKFESDTFFKYSQIAASALMAFMHGAQDSQKFTGILMLSVSASGGFGISASPSLMLLICSLTIAAGTASGGSRIIKKVGMDMLNMRRDQGFSADMAGAFCLFVSTVFGLPVSTTHTKTAAVLGVGAAKSIKSVNWSVAGEMLLAWILTFPGCAMLSFIITQILLR